MNLEQTLRYVSPAFRTGTDLSVESALETYKIKHMAVGFLLHVSSSIQLTQTKFCNMNLTNTRVWLDNAGSVG